MAICSPRQLPADQVACLERPTRLIQHKHAAAGQVGIVVVVADILVQHLANETSPLHEQDRLSGQQWVLRGQPASDPTYPMVEVCTARRHRGDLPSRLAGLVHSTPCVRRSHPPRQAWTPDSATAMQHARGPSAAFPHCRFPAQRVVPELPNQLGSQLHNRLERCPPTL